VQSTDPMRQMLADQGADQGAPLRPIAVSPGLMAYLDQGKRRRILAKWREGLGLNAR
jgi:hypothetical protein